ncbi:MAG: hexokinase, partial [Phycisphaerae bacterium]
GLAGQDSSLAMIPTYIEMGKSLPVGEPVIVMDAGGTNFRAAIVTFDGNGKAVIEKLYKKKMPGIDKEVSAEEFFDIIAGYIGDIIGAGKRIGFCFSYNCEITPEKDGRLVAFSKEIKVPQVVGQLIGENLKAALARAGLDADKRIVILNDTVTTLLSGAAGFSEKQYDSFVGFILGTGTNTCYIEKNENIKKLSKLDAGKEMIINIESGGLDIKRGEIDERFDSTTDSPGMQKFEKMISGAYLGGLCLEVVKFAAEDDLFSSPAAENLKKIKKLDTKNISDYLAEPSAAYSPLGEAIFSASNYDKALMEALIGAIIERAAKLVAINLSAVILKAGKGKNPDRPVCIVAEGTTYYNMPGLKEKVEKYLDEFLTAQNSCHYQIVHVDNATLIGAAIAGLTN